jgi:hypothetical protein
MRSELAYSASHCPTLEASTQTDPPKPLIYVKPPRAPSRGTELSTPPRQKGKSRRRARSLDSYKPLPRVGVDPDGYRTHALMMHIVVGDDSVMAPSSESDLFGSSSDTDGGVNDLFRPAGLPPTDANGCHADLDLFHTSTGAAFRVGSPVLASAGPDKAAPQPPTTGSTVSTESGHPSTADRVADEALARLARKPSPAPKTSPYLLQFPAD